MWVRSKVRGREVAVFSLEDARVRFKFTPVFLGDLSPHVRNPSHPLLDSEFHVTDSGFRIPDSRYWIPVFLSGTWIPDPLVSGISDFLSCIPDSKAQDSGFHSKFFQDFEFHKQKFRGLRNPDSLTLGDLS